jgi:hypothetical protein
MILYFEEKTLKSSILTTWFLKKITVYHRADGRAQWYTTRKIESSKADNERHSYYFRKQFIWLDALKIKSKQSIFDGDII